MSLDVALQCRDLLSGNLMLTRFFWYVKVHVILSICAGWSNVFELVRSRQAVPSTAVHPGRASQAVDAGDTPGGVNVTSRPKAAKGVRLCCRASVVHLVSHVSSL